MINLDVPEHLKPYLEVEDYENFPISRYYVSNQLKMIIARTVRMKKLKKQMNELNLPYLNTILMYGVPGTGKTTCGRYLAYHFKVPFVYVNFAKLFDGVFGNTSRIISDIFRFMADTECIFMLDEIDCISQKRGTEGAATGGEISRITVTIMQEFDILKKKDMKCILVGATNRRDIMDDALFSRFNLAVELQPLNNEEKELYMVKFLEDIGVPYSPENIKAYCSRTSAIRQRNVEADMISGIIEWLSKGKEGVVKVRHVMEDR